LGTGFGGILLLAFTHQVSINEISNLTYHISTPAFNRAGLVRPTGSMRREGSGV
jgi:hypothetical protein